MAALFQNNGLNPLNQVILNKATGAPWVLHLYTNVITPAVTDTTSSYTECAVSGYASVSLTGSSWTGSATAGTDTETYPSITFTFNSYAGGTTIYGYNVTQTISSTTYQLASQNFASNYPIPSGGGQLIVNLTETLT